MHFVFGLVFGPWLFVAHFEFLSLFICCSCNLDGQKSISSLLTFHFKFYALWVEFWGFGEDHHGYSENQRDLFFVIITHATSPYIHLITT
ncbi:hypothetical protein Hanom_Chr17g01530161 [Helianthus anomalus]